MSMQFKKEIRMEIDEMLVVIKKMFDDSAEKTNRKIDGVIVVVENLENKIQIIAEGHDILNRKMDNMEIKIDKIENRMDKMENKMDRMETNMDVIKNYVIGVDARLNEHEIILKRVM